VDGSTVEHCADLRLSSPSSAAAFDPGSNGLLIIPLIIPTIRLRPSGPDQIDAAPIMSRQFPSRSVQSDAKHLPRNRKVVGSNPTSGSKTAGQSRFAVVLSLALLAILIILCARTWPGEARPVGYVEVCLAD
jgi:hypothetical protein